MKKYRRRARFTEAEVTRMWERWHQGDSLHTIAHLLDTSHTSLRRHLVASGGIRPGQRTRCRLALTLSEREEISRGMVAGHSLRSIAKVLGRAPSKDTQTVIDVLTQQIQKLPHELAKSLTWDRGREMADHQRFSLATDMQVYFCEPHSPWQRGSNENTNGLLRQYFPKGLDLPSIHPNKLNAVARQLNERPRKTLNYETPAERFNQCVASTG